MMKSIFGTLLCLLLTTVWVVSTGASDFKLELLQVLFRHGDRTARKIEVYKNDPYVQYYEELGYGVLEVGMEREYKLGQVLRQRYNEFLKNYKDGQVYAYSTDYIRTKQSLRLVLAGLYIPSIKTVLTNDTKSIPIPINYDENKFNFLRIHEACTTYHTIYQQVEESPGVKKMFEKYNDFAKKMNNKTGELYPTTKLYRLFNNLRAALSMGLSLPDWCTKEDFEKLEDLAHLAFLIRTYTPQMTRIITGPIVQKFLENIERSGKGLDEKEIYLYSGHDINIALFCNAHNFTEVPKIPDYGSSIIVEKLRGPDSQVYVRFLMWTGATSEEFIPINVKGCGYECPISQYKSLVTSILPDEESKSCYHVPSTYRTQSHM